jgi:hypothetical protein
MPSKTIVTCDQCGADLSSKPDYRLKLELEPVAVGPGGFRGGWRPMPLMLAAGGRGEALLTAWFCGARCMREWSLSTKNMRQEEG